MQKLKIFNILVVSKNILFNVADTVDEATKMGIKVRWTDKVLGEISAKFTVLREVQLLRLRMKELQKELEEAGSCLAELDTETLYRDFNPILLPITKLSCQSRRVSLYCCILDEGMMALF